MKNKTTKHSSMTNQERKQQTLTDWVRSGLSPHAFAKQKGVNVGTMYHWVKEWKNNNPPPTVTVVPLPEERNHEKTDPNDKVAHLNYCPHCGAHLAPYVRALEGSGF